MDKADLSENSESVIPEANKGKVSTIHRKLFLQALNSLQFGSLSLTWPNGQTTHHGGKTTWRGNGPRPICWRSCV